MGTCIDDFCQGKQEMQPFLDPKSLSALGTIERQRATKVMGHQFKALGIARAGKEEGRQVICVGWKLDFTVKKSIQGDISGW